MIFSDQTTFPRTVTTMDLVMKPTVSVNMAGWRWEMMGIHSEGYKHGIPFFWTWQTNRKDYPGLLSLGSCKYCSWLVRLSSYPMLSNVIQCYPSGEGQYQGAAKPGEELVMDCRVEKAGVLDGFESIESIWCYPPEIWLGYVDVHGCDPSRTWNKHE